MRLSCTIKNLRGKSSDWKKSNPIIPDGAIAILKHDDKHCDIKIGNGELSFSELPYLGSRVVYPTLPSYRLSRGESARFGEIDMLGLAVTDPPDEDYYAYASFDTPDGEIIFDFLSSAKFTGTDCEAGIFSPKPLMHYSLFFWYDGIMNCIVRGVSND